MPNNLPAVFFGILPLIETDENAENSGHATVSFRTCLFSDGTWALQGLEYGAAVITLHHYVPKGTPPPETGAVVYCSGSLRTSLKAGKLSIHLNTFTLTPFPGNPDSEDYEATCPPPMHLQLSLIGTVSTVLQPLTPTPRDLRGFEITSSVYGGSKTERSVPLAIRAMFPLGPRWDPYHIPKAGSMVAVTGEIIGIHEKSQCIVLGLQSMEYVQPRANDSGTPSATPASSQSPTQKKARFSKWLGPQTSPSPAQPALTRTHHIPAKSSKKGKERMSPLPTAVHVKTERQTPSGQTDMPQGSYRRRKQTRKALENIADASLSQITSTQAVPDSPIQIDESSELSELSEVSLESEDA